MSGARIHRSITAAATAALVVALIPGIVSAALPDATATTTAIVPTYSAGGTTGFSGELDYHASSGTLSRLTLAVTLTGVDTTVAPYIDASIDGASAGTCSTTFPITCTFRNVRAGEVVTVVVGVKTAASQVTALYTWETSGAGSGSGDQSHGDTWADDASAGVSADAVNFGGGFGLTNGWGIGNAQSLSASNQQAAKLQNLLAGIIGTVQDGSTAFGCVSTATAICPTRQIGETIVVNVDNGATQSALFAIIASYASGTPTPKGYVHLADGSTTPEFIDACAKRNPTYPCFTWNPKLNQATITTDTNGSYKGYN